MRSTVMELCQYCSTRMVRTTALQAIWTLGLTVCEHVVWENLNSSPSSLFPNVDNGYYFPYSPRYRNRRDETAVSVLLKKDGERSQVRRKDPVLLLPWWKEILGTIIFCIAATTYIVRKFFHPPTTYARVNKDSSACTDTQIISCLLLCQINSKSHACCTVLNSSMQQRKESETQCQTDNKFELDVAEPKEVVITETRPCEYVSR